MSNLYDPFERPAPRVRPPMPIPLAPSVAHRPAAPLPISVPGCLHWFGHGFLFLCIVVLALGWGFEHFQPEKPRPGPEPPRPTPVITGKIWVILVKDSEHPSQDYAQVEDDPALTEGVNSLGARLRSYDITSNVLDQKHLRAHVEKAGGPPVLIIEAEGSRKIVAMKLPKTAAEVVDQVRNFKGASG